MTSLSELATRVSEAQPGDTIIMPEGVYDGDTCHIMTSGSAEQPIVIRAKNIGKAVIQGPISVKGDYIHLVGFHFAKQGNVEILGTGCRVSRCVMNDVQVGKWIRILPGSQQIEIDRCRFQNKTNNLIEPRGCQMMQIVVRNEGENHHIHHNHFVDIPKGKTNNGYETLQLITEGNPFDPKPGACGTVIEDNLFERCNGEAEVISVKSNNNMLRRNTFRDCRGGLVLRHGDGNTVSDSFFLGDNESHAGGVRLQGEDQVVVNNIFRSLSAYGVAMMDGTPDSLYVRTERALIAFNTFAGCSPALVIGQNHSKHPNGTAPKDCVIANNAFILARPSALGGDLKTVKLVKDDEPVGWTWEGNITDGDLGMPDREGIKIEQLDMTHLSNGVVVPTKSNRLIRKAQGDYPDITTDVLGRSRGKRKTVGCVDRPSLLEDGGGPLVATDVGPE
jgi:poly(beta-D-mannuronate) lyase